MDYAVRAINKTGHISAFAAVTTGLVGQAAKLHRCSPTAAAALGRSLTAVSLTGLMLKNDSDRLTLQVTGGWNNALSLRGAGQAQGGGKAGRFTKSERCPKLRLPV